MEIRSYPKDFPWLTADLEPFIFFKETETYVHLSFTMIDDITWEDLNRSTLRLIGQMPKCQRLLEFEVGDQLLILHKKCGERDEFTEEEIVIRITHIEKLEWSLSNLCPFGPEGQDIALLWLTAQGKMEFVW